MRQYVVSVKQYRSHLSAAGIFVIQRYVSGDSGKVAGIVDFGQSFIENITPHKPCLVRRE